MSYNISRSRPRDITLRVVGHPYSPSGMGEHVRSVWRSLQQVGIPAKLVDIYGPFSPPDPALKQEFDAKIVENLGDGINIYCINGDEIEQALQTLRNRRPFAPGSRNIIYPFWELEGYPSSWAEQLMRFDEVWAPSAFIREAVSKVVSIPVQHMPIASEVRQRGLQGRRCFGIRESAYAFLFFFDYLSYVERKNPFAVMQAFQKLLEMDPDADVVLIVKTNNSGRRPDMQASFEKAMESLGDRCVAITSTLPELEMKSLIWLADCFVSLHRSEGFGLGLAESMVLGKPTIATAYSGNMDFCNEETCFLIPYELVPLRNGDYPHWENQHWADADVDAAARAMLALVRDPELGRRAGRRARRHIALNFSYLAIGLNYARRIGELSETLRSEVSVAVL